MVNNCVMHFRNSVWGLPWIHDNALRNVFKIQDDLAIYDKLSYRRIHIMPDQKIHVIANCEFKLNILN